jgi:phage tail-like protein
MTQARSGSSLRLSLTPMHIPNATTPTGIGQNSALQTPMLRDGGVTDITVTNCELLLYPGEPGEIVVQIKNLGTQTLDLSLEVKGDFPTAWCQTRMEGHELSPRQQIDALLYFQTPANFFEDPQALGSGQALLLDYRSRLYVYYTERETGQQRVETAAFNLYVRPRSLYPTFLPAIYQEEDFVSRFLKIFEQAFEPSVQTLDALWAHLDPLTAPEALLPFLASWVAWPMDSRWNTTRQRYLIRQAVELYRWRGTRRGLRLYLHLYTDLPLDDHLTQEADKHISIEEIFGQGFVFGQTHLGQDSMLGGGRPYHFIVRLRCEENSRIDERLVREVIEREKPAFCTYDLHIESSPDVS